MPKNKAKPLPDKLPPVWIAAGGTGGHISPGVALTETLAERNVPVVFFTLPRNHDYPDILKLKKTQLAKVVEIPAPRLPNNLRRLLRFPLGFLKSWFLIRREWKMQKPAAVISMGGYSGFQVLLFAQLKKIPIFLCEQNAVHGRVTRLFENKAKRVFLSFPPDPKTKKENQVFSGNPLRAVFRKTRPHKPSRKKIRQIFIIGGSQGARDLNRLYTQMASMPFFRGIQFTLSCGPDEYPSLSANARDKDRIFPFIEDMPGELLKADLVISRAGSGLLYEILWARKPSILIPYPYAADDHQRLNALALAHKNLSLVLDTRPFSAESAAREIQNILEQDQLSEIQNSLANHTFPLNAEQTIVDEVLRLL